jgi:2-methylcitrate dehydratase PrpD
MTPRTHLEHAAVWAASFDLSSAPDDVLALACAQIANALAAVHAGARSEAGLKVWRAHHRTLGQGPCLVVPFGVRAPLFDALYLNAVFANALELDDFGYRGHLCPAVLAPLTLSALLDADGASVLRAIIVANELAGRLGVSVTAELRHGHQRSYLLRLAAAAAAGALLRLDAPRLAMAYAIALTQPEVPLHRGEYSPDTKVLSAASSVVEGTRAAFLAQEGVGAALDILEHQSGFYRQLTMHRQVAQPFVQLGDAWCTHALSFKRYAACGYAAGAVDAACALHRHPEFARAAITDVEIAAALPAIVLERLADPHEPGVLTPVNVQFSTIRSTAAALWLGELRGGHYAAGSVSQVYDAVGRLESRTRLVHDWRFTVHSLQGLDAGLNREAAEQSADLFQFHRTMREFRKMFGSASPFSWQDVGRIARLPPEERRFYLAHWWRSVRPYLGRRRRSTDEAPGPFGDLRLMSFRPSARVTVRFLDGRQLSAEQLVPSGFAGDPNRISMVHEKLMVEADAALGAAACERLWELIKHTRTAPRASAILEAAIGRSPHDTGFGNQGNQP